MKSTLFAAIAAFFLQSSSASAIPAKSNALAAVKQPRASCENTATSRSCWGDYSTDTDWYTVTPDTGVTREYWLSVENTTLSIDGYLRSTLTFNGTIPGPTIIADWGDNLVIHVSNNLESNGTAIHWHGIRQLGSVEYDGVPGVTQCPIAPGSSLTYKFQATQYGTTWYHSHFTLQYADGLQGGLIINGPATADYDEDLGIMTLSDWGHASVFTQWDAAKLGAPPSQPNGLVNGTNTFDCTTVDDANCIGGGTKWNTTFVSGTKYRLRLINTATDGHFDFSIDGHNFTVIANDLVPLVPFVTDNLLISIGQRYDIIIEANADAGNYWLRAGWQNGCTAMDNPLDVTGIIRYDSTSTDDPTSNSSITLSTFCGDQALTDLVPYLAMDVGTYSEVAEQTLFFNATGYFHWTLNDSSLFLNWSDPTTLKIFNDEAIFPTDYNVIAIDNNTAGGDEWIVYVIEDDTGFGIYHPIHLHGHDFYIIAQDTGTFDAATTVVNTINPPRRDVAVVPNSGFLAIAFKLDNPGSWLLHCHIAWHASEGLAMQFVESQDDIAVTMTDTTIFEDTCSVWQDYTTSEAWPQGDSGI